MNRALIVPILLAACVGSGTTPDVVVTPTGPATGAPGEWGPWADPAAHPTGSSALARTANGGVVLADPDTDALVYRNGSGPGLSVLVGNEPTRIAPLGQDFLVTLRHDGAVARVGAHGTVRAVVPAGLEPYGVVSRADGLRAWVASSLDGRVLELDGETLEVVRTFDVGGEPRWLALSADGSTLWVARTTGDAPLTRIDLSTGEATAVALPGASRMVVDPPRVPLKARITGDISWSVALDALVVPVLYADTSTPIVQVDVVDPGTEGPPAETYGPNGGDEAAALMAMMGMALETIGKFTPAVVVIPDSGPASALYAGVQILPPGQEVDSADSGLFPFATEARTYLSAVTATPDGLVLATMEASDVLVVMDPEAPLSGEPPLPPSMRENEPERGGMQRVPVTAIRTRARPSSVLSTEDGAVVGSVIGRGIQRVPTGVASVTLDVLAAQGVNGFASLIEEELLGAPLDPVLEPSVALGRVLFHAALDDRVGAGGVSCSTCHVEGRNDGFTWTFANGPRQTPSLAGRVSDTTPLTWTEGVGSVVEEARTTIQHRMGGQGLTLAEEQALADYVDWTRPVLRAAPGEAAERGRIVFERGDVGCTACHAGARGTDGLPHLLRGVALDTPALDGVGATGPWLHDGSAATLRDVLDPTVNGGMGSTGHLTEQELDDLVAYLQSR